MSYTYDELSRMTSRTVCCCEEACVCEDETFLYDAAGNLTNTGTDTFAYDANNRLIQYNGHAISYDNDGNMITTRLEGIHNIPLTFDSENRLISAHYHTYTYNAEDVRIRNLRGGIDKTYTYDMVPRLNRLLTCTNNGVVTKYVYGLGLIGEESSGTFKTYHYDYRGSTVAITDPYGNILDSYQYDAYGKVICGAYAIDTPFLYNGRDGVMTDWNGLYYMRARYYSPELRRFINADIIPGKIFNAITLNRYAYANGNPAMCIDPLGLTADRSGTPPKNYVYGPTLLYNPPIINKTWQELGFKYDGSLRDFKRLEQGLPPYAYEVWLKQEQVKQTYYSVSWKSISGSVGNDIASASGRLYAGTAYAGLMDEGFGVEAGISGATAGGNLTLGNLSLDGEINALAAEASAKFLYDDGFNLGAEAKVSVATAEGSVTVDLWFMEIEIGANADFLSAGAEANVTAGKNDEGQFEIGAEAGIGALIFGLGFDIAFIFG